jgi:hypothetical protein
MDSEERFRLDMYLNDAPEKGRKRFKNECALQDPPKMPQLETTCSPKKDDLMQCLLRIEAKIENLGESTFEMRSDIDDLGYKLEELEEKISWIKRAVINRLPEPENHPDNTP